MNPSILALGWRTLLRDLRAGGLRLMFWAVALAVAALTSVGFFADRLQGGLVRDAAQLLGGDVVVASDQPTPAAFAQQAQALGLRTSTTVSFPTMARAPDAQGGASRLVALKAVAPGYPLRGSLRVADAPGAPDAATQATPARGEVWLDAPLLEALGLAMGDTLLLGDAQLRIARILTLEPDRGAGFLSFAPRVMLHAADLPATGLVQPASRLTYRFAVAGPDAAVQPYRAWAQEQAQRPDVHGLRVESLDSGSPEMRQTLERAQKFLNLVALLAALLSAVAVALAARAFAAEHLDAAALLRVLGLSQRRIAWAYTVEFTLVGLAASATGVLMGFGVHHLFVQLLAGLIEAALPAPGPWPAVLGLGLGLTLLLAFGLPPVLQLARVPPLRVIRRDLGALKPASVAVLALGVAGFAALLLAVSSDLKLGLIAVGGFAAAVLLFALLAWLAVRLLRRSVNEATAPRWLVLATRQLAARPAYAVVQVSSLAVGLLALVLLVLLRTDLIASWRQATPADAPNRFVINILPDQAQDFQQALRAAGVARYDWYPMFRGRLVAVNERPVGPQDYTEDRAKRLVDREFNLSNAAEAPGHNQIVAGRWTPGEQGTVSVEEGIAQLYRALLGFYARHPELLGNPLVLAGESYAGTYLPLLARAIRDGNGRDGNPVLDLRTVVLADAWVDPMVQMATDTTYALNHGLITPGQKVWLDEKYRHNYPQINQAIQQLDKVTQQNAGASEEMSGTSEELAAQAEELQTSIAFFRVDNVAAGAKSAQRKAPQASRQTARMISGRTESVSRTT